MESFGLPSKSQLKSRVPTIITSTKSALTLAQFAITTRTHEVDKAHHVVKVLSLLLRPCGKAWTCWKIMSPSRRTVCKEISSSPDLDLTRLHPLGCGNPLLTTRGCFRYLRELCSCRLSRVILRGCVSGTLLMRLMSIPSRLAVSCCSPCGPPNHGKQQR